MKKPFATAFRVSTLIVLGILSIPVLLDQQDLMQAVSFGLVVGVPAWIVVSLFLGCLLRLTCPPEKPKKHVTRIRATILREEL